MNLFSYYRKKTELQKLELEKAKIVSTKSTVEKRISNAKEKLKLSTKNLEKAKKSNADHAIELEDTTKKTNEAQMEKEEFELKLQDDKVMDEEMKNEYIRLKNEVGLKSAKYIEELNKIKANRKEHRDELENELRRQSEIEIPLQQKKEDREAAYVTLSKLKKSEESAVTALTEARKLEKILEDEIATSNAKIKNLEVQLKEISLELEKFKAWKHNAIHLTKSNELEANLKMLFPGRVFGRIKNLCRTTGLKYRTAVTRVLEKKMDFFVVDNEETAQKCIDYLREHKFRLETFLPLDNLRVTLNYRLYFETFSIIVFCYLLGYPISRIASYNYWKDGGQTVNGSAGTR